jgi:leader peptidase (prepilin peptidase) / N-methyltransferase
VSAFVAAAAGALGVVCGSFASVVAYRVPRDESIVKPGSHCPMCEAPLKAIDNVPLLSYALLRGRCRNCGSHIAPRYPAVELVTGLLFALVALRIGSYWAIPAFSLLALTLVIVSLTDLETRRIPAAIVYVSAAIGAPLLILASAGTHDWRRLAEAAIGAAIAFAVYFLIFFAVPKGMGYGDVRLAGLVGGFLGWLGYRVLALGILGGFIIGGLVGLGLVVFAHAGRKTKIPFGPFIAAGTMLAVLLGPGTAGHVLL